MVYPLELSTSDFCRFRSVSNNGNVFFDENNELVVTVLTDDSQHVTVTSFDSSCSFEFLIPNKGPVIAIKFSPGFSILAIQRNKNSVECLNLTSCQPSGPEYSQLSKSAGNTILGFCWVGDSSLAFITNQGIELYQINSEKRTFSSTKNINVKCHWFSHCPRSNFVVLATGQQGTTLNPFQLRHNSISKYAKFEVDPGTPSVNSRTSLAERNVTLATLYGQISVLVLRHVARQTEQKAEVIIYPILKDSSSKPSAILRLDMTGRFAINILDNLVVVHHQSSKTSVLFDIRCRPESREGVTPTFAKLGMPKTIREFYLPAADLAPFPAPERSMPVEMYASSWVIFQPDIIIDAKLGCMWKLSLLLEPLANMISDPVSCSDVLLRRTEGKTVLLGRLQRWVTGESCDLFSLGTVFDKVNEMYRQNVEIELESQMGTPVNSASYLKISTKIRPVVVVDQCDIYSQVFLPLADGTLIAESANLAESLNESPTTTRENDEIEVGQICNGKINNGDREVKVSSKTRKKCIAVTTSYIRSLIQWHLPVQHYIYELLIGLLLESDNFYQLHQMLQYHAISDSKPLACLLLSLEPKYPAAVQLAVDMLRRLGNASEEIIEVLLSQNKVLTAITYARNNGLGDSISARKFLEAVSNTGDLKAFFSVYNFFEQRNLKLRGSSIFAKGERCEDFVKTFTEEFGTSTSL
ncbi:regulator of MON1-CCZ1 complex-like [Artemia franciscana]|uniref:Mic1 domain-containing protein n=1 Tax=Artemia franciscana TaxID=6661 RepID=A0AA88I950_ARTSF|nr:hypothetical protein QYM36_002195 [Artemia franciscana]KAK2723769.1 hypothetical protein QYM36_002195 [Artemia franciscana]KAK2723770.1 hypothetical protein QYM36_002195 [Artemia franciscana]